MSARLEAQSLTLGGVRASRSQSVYRTGTYARFGDAELLVRFSCQPSA